MAPVASLHAPEVACAVVKDPVRKVIAPQVVARHALQSMRGLEQAGMQRVSCTEHDRSGFVMLAANMTLNGDSSSSMYWWAYSPGRGGYQRCNEPLEHILDPVSAARHTMEGRGRSIKQHPPCNGHGASCALPITVTFRTPLLATRPWTHTHTHRH